ncbi:DUF1799 domain-containing protein [Bradyrhizobium sp. BR 10289]|uniref:DUF1799 domain-containing protein n=1 Tax=Bradyrhizobium sp. BR 10289 TaxID=2749993 RepID=UPI001C64BDF1|nr:DUF1799 domain-containing protein [Bradyrhizobium sp. BR 10289]MBW7968115.1 DUF1799 domain-containing protein [Bradyrhizobium sp. BR 10289]
MDRDVQAAIEGARHAGFDADSLAELRETIAASEPPPAGDGEFTHLWSGNLAIVDAFLRVSSQWRVVACSAGGAIMPVGGMISPTVAIYISLDYAAVRAGLDAEGITVTPELWRGIRIMESAAAAMLNEAG